MQTGIAFEVISGFDSELWGLPQPSGKRWLTHFKKSATLEILYHFQYNPQSWKEWQRVAAIKIQIAQRIPDIEFADYEPNGTIEIAYTVAELGKYFPQFIWFPKPKYPTGKDDFFRHLKWYAQKLYYLKMLHIEAVIAMAIHFNEVLEKPYSYREVMRKAKAVCALDRSEWRQKLSKEDLRAAHQKGAHITNEIKRERSNANKEKAMQLRTEGMTLQQIADEVGVSLRTVKSWKLPKKSA